MCSVKKAIVLIALVALASGLHIELGKKLINNHASNETEVFQRYIDASLAELNKPNKLHIDWQSLSLENTKDTKNSVDFTYKATVDDIPFTLTSTIALVPSGEAGIYKHNYSTSIRTIGLKSAELDSTVKHVALDFFQELTQWTHINRLVNTTSLTLKGNHFILITLGKIAGAFYTNG